MPAADMVDAWHNAEHCTVLIIVYIYYGHFKWQFSAKVGDG